MTIYITSDFHVGHSRVLDFCERPYKDVMDMNEQLIEQWNTQVRDNDLVYVLGDFSLSKKWALATIPRLKGHTVLYVGNHDACFDYERKESAASKKKEYIDVGFSAVRTGSSMCWRNGEKYVTVWLHHFPPAHPKQKDFDDRYWEHRLQWSSAYLYLHGHLHVQHYLKYRNMIDVGIDHNFKLWSQKEILDLYNDSRVYIPSRLSVKNAYHEEMMKLNTEN